MVPDEHTVSLTKLIEYVKPQIKVELKTGDEDDSMQEVTVNFDSLKSFRADDLKKRISILQKQDNEEKRYLKIKAELERSKHLQEIIQDPKKKAAFLDILESIREELESKQQRKNWFIQAFHRCMAPGR